LPWLELLAGLSAGRISEVFGLGTAAGVAGVAHIGSAAGDVDIGGGEIAGRLQAALRSEQLGAGRHPDWLFSVET
jgi:branched-subunit amino acid aminotransferase/4-amino-4-deoxychorismate lyase